MMLINRRTRHFQRHGALPIRYLCLALGMIGLTACDYRTTQWTPAESPKKNRVSWAEYHHPVYFTGTSVKLTKTETEALERFLSRVARGDGVYVYLATGSADPSTLIKQRESSLAHHLMGGGYSVSRVRANRPVSSRSNTVRITVGRYIVTPPNCPDWSKNSAGDPFNSETSNFRCANETNLGLMIADPEALIRGTPTGPGDGESFTPGIGKYRSGEIEKPPATSAREAVGGGGKSE
jgi:pilus assembly protein CpaD